MTCQQDTVWTSILCDSPGTSDDGILSASQQFQGSISCLGDDDGLIKTWDQRQSDATSSFEAHSDFVSDMVYHEREQCLIAVSGDGTLSVNDLRTNKASLCHTKLCP